jgi:hypothetical protein
VSDEVQRPFHIDTEPFAGFELAVLADRTIYAQGQTVRLTVTATNAGDRFVEHEYPGWQRYRLAILDEHHRVVADDEVTRGTQQPGLDRWLPGQIAIFPVYWNQTGGPLVPAWTDEPPGPPVEPGRYRARVTWIGREPGERQRLADAFSRWFELT